jgi:hypothetical protein
MVPPRLVAFAVLVMLMAGGIAWCVRAFQNRLIVENRSGQPVSLLMIGIYGSSSSFMFENMPDGSESSASFNVVRDGGFYVHGFLADGTKITEGNYGYVTNGMYGETAHFTVKQGGKIDFSQGKE